MEKLNSLEELLLHEVKDLYHAEKQLVKALPKVAKRVSSPELRNAVEEHLSQTEQHVNRLEQVFQLLGAEAKATKCKGMHGILAEAEDVMDQKGTPETLDAAIIMSAQKVEHYEIAGYGSAATWASMMGRQDIKNLLGQTLDEEEKTDRKLTELAKAWVNPRASEQPSERQFAT